MLSFINVFFRLRAYVLDTMFCHNSMNPFDSNVPVVYWLIRIETISSSKCWVQACHRAVRTSYCVLYPLLKICLICFDVHTGSATHRWPLYKRESLLHQCHLNFYSRKRSTYKSSKIGPNIMFTSGRSYATAFLFLCRALATINRLL